MKQIICTECKKPIEYKMDLKVAGKLLQPYHASCLSRPNTKLGKMHRFTGAFPTGLKFWILIIIGNIVLAKLISDNGDSTAALIFIAIVFNAVFMFARIGIYYCYEQHLKEY